MGLWDAVSIIVGIVIGAGVYETAPLVLANVPDPWTGLGVWALGGALSLCGALCYAELATTFPQSGGDYVYLKRAYGPLLGFLFGWTQLCVVITASIGAMAFVFADYAVRLTGDASASAARVQPPELAVAAVAGLTLLNILSSVAGKNVQNVLTAAKIIGMTAIVCAGFGWGSAAAWTETAPAATSNLGLAMILVLYTYGGWNDAAFVAAEVRDPSKNIPRALALGVGCITAAYLLVNAAYIGGLGFAAARASHAIAADTLALAWGSAGAKAMCLLVMLSALAHATADLHRLARVCRLRASAFRGWALAEFGSFAHHHGGRRTAERTGPGNSPSPRADQIDRGFALGRRQFVFVQIVVFARAGAPQAQMHRRHAVDVEGMAARGAEPLR